MTLFLLYNRERIDQDNRNLQHPAREEESVFENHLFSNTACIFTNPKQKYTNLLKEGSWIKTKEKKHQQVVFATQKKGESQKSLGRKKVNARFP